MMGGVTRRRCGEERWKAGEYVMIVAQIEAMCFGLFSLGVLRCSVVRMLQEVADSVEIGAETTALRWRGTCSGTTKRKSALRVSILH